MEKFINVIHSFICSFVSLLAHPFIHSLIHLSLHSASFAHSFLHSTFFHSFVRSWILLLPGVHHVPSTPPQINPPPTAITPDEAKVPNSESKHENTQQSKTCHRDFENSPNPIDKDQKHVKKLVKGGSEKSEELSTLPENESLPEKEYEPHKLLTKKGSDQCLDLCTSTCSTKSCNGDNGVDLHLFTRETDEDDDDVNCVLLGDEESCDLTMLGNPQSALIIKQFNEKYSQQHASNSTRNNINTRNSNRSAKTLTSEEELHGTSVNDCSSRISKTRSDAENVVKKSCGEETSCISLSGKEVSEMKETVLSLTEDSAQENQNVNRKKTPSVNTNNTNKTTSDIMNTNAAIITPSSDPQSRIPSDLPSITSNTPVSNDPQFGFSSSTIIGNILMNNGTVSHLTSARYAGELINTDSNGVRFTIPIPSNPGSSISSMFSVPHLGSIPYIMMLMSNGNSAGLSIPIYSSLHPLYVQPSMAHPSLITSQYNQDNTTSQIRTQQHLPTTGASSCAQRSSSSTNVTALCNNTTHPFPLVYKNTNTEDSLSNSDIESQSLAIPICNTSPCTTVRPLYTVTLQCDKEDSSMGCLDHSACSVSSSTPVTVCIAATTLSNPDVCSTKPPSDDNNISLTRPTETSANLSVTPSSIYETSILTSSTPSSCSDNSSLSCTAAMSSCTTSFEDGTVLNDGSLNTDQACAGVMDVTMLQSSSSNSEHTFKTPKRIEPIQGRWLSLELHFV